MATKNRMHLVDISIPIEKKIVIMSPGRNFELSITQKEFNGHKAQNLVAPKGHRKFTVKDAALAWRHSQEFRDYMCAKIRKDGNEGAILWTGEEDLFSDHYHKITRLGNFEKVSDDIFFNLPLELKACHSHSKGPICISVDCVTFGLTIEGRSYLENEYPTAFVRELSHAEFESMINRTEARRELEELKKHVDIRKIPNIEKLVRGE